ncbi:MAG: hypothetical protein AB8B91_11945 [Rubripirellula sp.]
MLTKLSLRNRLFACVAAGGLCLAGTTPTLAADCGCEATCQVCPIDPVECQCDCSCKKKPNLVYKALDSVAGGIEKLFGLDKCGKSDCDNIVCDDGCDAMMMEELMMPSPPVIHDSAPIHQHHHHSHSAPMPPAVQHSAPVIQSAPVYTGPAEKVHVKPMGPNQWEQPSQPTADPSTSNRMEMTQPRMVQPRAVQAREVEPRATQPRAVQPREVQRQPMVDPDSKLDSGNAPEAANAPQVPIPETMPRNNAPAPQVEDAEEGGSLFDTLSNPFGDDEARIKLPRPVRPSNYEQPAFRPINKRPLSRSYNESNRRVRSVR